MMFFCYFSNQKKKKFPQQKKLNICGKAKKYNTVYSYLLYIYIYWMREKRHKKWELFGNEFSNTERKLEHTR